MSEEMKKHKLVDATEPNLLSDTFPYDMPPLIHLSGPVVERIDGKDVEFDIAAVSKKHVAQVTLQRFAPLRLAQESLTALPELVDALAKMPRLVTEGLQLVEQTVQRPSENPFAGLRATLFGGACLVAGAILAGFGGPWPIWALLFIIGILLPLRRK